MIEENLQVKQVIQNSPMHKQSIHQEQLCQEQQKYHEQIQNDLNIQSDNICPIINIYQVASEEQIEQQSQKQKKLNQKDHRINNFEEMTNQNQVKKQFQKQIEPKNEIKQEKNLFQQERQDKDHGFTINVCHIQSQQSLPQNAEYADDTHIQPHHSHLQDLKREQKQIKCREQKKSQSIFQQEKPQYDDYYVQLLEQKWAQRQLEKKLEKEKAQNNKKQQTNGKDLKIIQDMAKKQPIQQKKIQNEKPSIKQKNSNSLSNKNSPLFKITKKKDDRMSRTGQKFRSKDEAKTQNNTLNIRIRPILQNKSEIISPVNKQNQDTYRQKIKIIKRSVKKHLSNNVQNFYDKSLSRSHSKKIRQTAKPNKLEHDISYEISLSGQVQMMSKILQDRYYNTNKSQNHNSSIKNEQKQSYQKQRYSQITGLKRNMSQGNKIRKIIKRSPYGLLQIQVKQKKNNPKITNLRILKPKQMIKLKKVSKTNKINQQRKQNFMHQDRQNFFKNKEKVFSKRIQGQLPSIVG